MCYHGNRCYDVLIISILKDFYAYWKIVYNVNLREKFSPGPGIEPGSPAGDTGSSPGPGGNLQEGNLYEGLGVDGRTIYNLS